MSCSLSNDSDGGAEPAAICPIEQRASRERVQWGKRRARETHTHRREMRETCQALASGRVGSVARRSGRKKSGRAGQTFGIVRSKGPAFDLQRWRSLYNERGVRILMNKFAADNARFVRPRPLVSRATGKNCGPPLCSIAEIVSLVTADSLIGFA